MALTEEKIKAMEAATGLKYSGPSSSRDQNQIASKSRADEIRAMASKSKNATFVDTLMGKIAQPKSATSFQGAEVAQPLVTQPEEVAKGIVKGIPGQAAQVTKGVEKVGKKAMETIGLDTAGTGLDYTDVEELTAPSNEAQELGYQGSAFIPAERAMTAAKPLVEAAKPILSKVGKELAETEGAQAMRAVGDFISEKLGKAKPSFGVKTEAEIMSMPADPEKLKKLTDVQREAYFSAKYKQASAAGKAEIDAVKKKTDDLLAQETTQLAKKSEELTKDLNTKSKEYDKVTYEEVQASKPVLAETLRKNGNHYVELIDKAMPPEVRNAQVTRNEIASQINAKVNSMDPASVADAQQKIAFINKYLPEGGANIGDLYDAMKAIRKENISKGTTRGKKVYSGDEYQALNTISEISDFLKNKGVDLSEANSFWRNNAEARDKFISIIQPFTTEGLETGGIKTFREAIQKRISGQATPEQESMLAKFEEYTGSKLGNDKTMQAFNKLSEAEKNLVAIKTEETIKKAAIEELKNNGIEAANKNAAEIKEELDKLKLTTDQKIAFKRKIQRAITYTLGAVGLPAIGYQLFND